MQPRHASSANAIVRTPRGVKATEPSCAVECLYKLELFRKFLITESAAKCLQRLTSERCCTRSLPRSCSTVPMAMASHHSSNTTTLVYVKSKEHAWLPAQIVEGTDDGNTVTVRSDLSSTRTVALQDYPHHSLPLQNIDPSSGQLRVVADLADLSFLHEVRCIKLPNGVYSIMYQ